MVDQPFQAPLHETRKTTELCSQCTKNYYKFHALTGPIITVMVTAINAYVTNLALLSGELFGGLAKAALSWQLPGLPAVLESLRSMQGTAKTRP
jgi:hypothetical protein